MPPPIIPPPIMPRGSAVVAKIRRARRGPCPCIRMKRWHVDTERPHCSAAVSESGDTVETKRAAHRFSAIRVRSLNDPRQGSLPTVQTVTLLSTPPRDTCIRCKPSHPSPSAREFRLPLSGLATFELRRMSLQLTLIRHLGNAADRSAFHRRRSFCRSGDARAVSCGSRCNRRFGLSRRFDEHRKFTYWTRPLSSCEAPHTWPLPECATQMFVCRHGFAGERWEIGYDRYYACDNFDAGHDGFTAVLSRDDPGRHLRHP
jgi:hypothetical protein